MIEILIIGGGINGLLLARELSMAGVGVSLLEKGECCQEASWAGGGIVSPLYPWRYRPPVTALASWAQQFYPELAESLWSTTGIDPEFQHSGLLMLDADDEAEALNWALENAQAMEPVDKKFLYQREPNLGGGYQRGLWMPKVANIRNPRLGQALVADLKARSDVDILERCQVTSFERELNKIIRVNAQGSNHDYVFEAKAVVFCAGAWSGLLTQQLGIKLQVEPVKGQMLLYKFSDPPLQSIVLSKGRYAIPRRDGHLLVGSTLEYQGFDKTSTDQARDSLQESAQQLLPKVKQMTPISQWAGLRPAAPDGIPYIGKLPGFDNVYINAGQFRNGLVLAPASARLMADILLDRTPIIDPAPYNPESRMGEEG